MDSSSSTTFKFNFKFNTDTLKQAVNEWCSESPESRLQVEKEYGPIAHWDTSKVTDMKELFRGKSGFNADLSQWNTSSVNDMRSMFSEGKTIASVALEYHEKAAKVRAKTRLLSLESEIARLKEEVKAGKEGLAVVNEKNTQLMAKANLAMTLPSKIKQVRSLRRDPVNAGITDDAIRLAVEEITSLPKTVSESKYILEIHSKASDLMSRYQTWLRSYTGKVMGGQFQFNDLPQLLDTPQEGLSLIETLLELKTDQMMESEKILRRAKDGLSWEDESQASLPPPPLLKGSYSTEALVSDTLKEIEKWSKKFSTSPELKTEQAIQALSQHIDDFRKALLPLPSKNSSTSVEIKEIKFKKVLESLETEEAFWNFDSMTDFPRTSLDRTVRGGELELEAMFTAISNLTAIFQSADNNKADLISATERLSRIKSELEIVEDTAVNVTTCDVTDLLASASKYREKMTQSIQIIKVSCAGAGTEEEKNLAFQNRTSARRDLMQNNLKIMKQIEKSFPSAKEGVGNIASAARSSFEDVVAVLTKEIIAAGNGGLEVFASLVKKWIAKLKQYLTEASKLDAAYNNVTKEVRQLTKWHGAQAQNISGVSVLHKGEELREAIEEARDDLLVLKRKIKRAKRQSDVNKLKELESNEKIARNKLKEAELKLDQEFASAINDINHFPELADKVSAFMDFDADLLCLWRERAFTDFTDKVELGGGRHRVFKARSPDGTIIVLKQCPVVGVRARKEVAKEVRIMNEIKHPNIMPIVSLFFDTPDEGVSSIYLVLPFCAGGNLEDYIERMQPGIERATLILQQTLDGIANMHSSKMVHGDLKPQNILMSAANQMLSNPLITDFETTRHQDATITKAGGGGTDGFRAPELLNNPNAVATEASDMFAFGEVLRRVKGVLREVDQAQADQKDLDDLITKLKDPVATKRPSANEAKNHAFFTAAAEPEETCECIVMAFCGGASCFACDGIKCSSGHFICNEDFEFYVNSLVKKNEGGKFSDLGEMIKNNGRIFCANRGSGCESAAFALRDIATHLSSDTLELLSECRKEVLRLQLEKDNEQVINDRVTDELEALERMSEHEKKVRAARKHIESNLLLMKCPNPDCRKPFLDWSDCAALTCKDEGGNGCGTRFCCYCVKAFPGDMHEHVLDCKVAGPEPDGVRSKLYPPRWYYDQVTSRVRKDRVVEYLRTLENDEIRYDVVEQCGRSFRDLNMNFPEWTRRRERSDSDIARAAQFDEYNNA